MLADERAGGDEMGVRCDQVMLSNSQVSAFGTDWLFALPPNMTTRWRQVSWHMTMSRRGLGATLGVARVQSTPSYNHVSLVSWPLLVLPPNKTVRPRARSKQAAGAIRTGAGVAVACGCQLRPSHSHVRGPFPASTLTRRFQSWTSTAGSNGGAATSSVHTRATASYDQVCSPSVTDTS